MKQNPIHLASYRVQNDVVGDFPEASFSDPTSSSESPQDSTFFDNSKHIQRNRREENEGRSKIQALTAFAFLCPQREDREKIHSLLLQLLNLQQSGKFSNLEQAMSSLLEEVDEETRQVWNRYAASDLGISSLDFLCRSEQGIQRSALESLIHSAETLAPKANVLMGIFGLGALLSAGLQGEESKIRLFQEGVLNLGKAFLTESSQRIHHCGQILNFIRHHSLSEMGDYFFQVNAEEERAEERSQAAENFLRIVNRHDHALAEAAMDGNLGHQIGWHEIESSLRRASLIFADGNADRLSILANYAASVVSGYAQYLLSKDYSASALLISGAIGAINGATQSSIQLMHQIGNLSPEQIQANRRSMSWQFFKGVLIGAGSGFAEHVVGNIFHGLHPANPLFILGLSFITFSVGDIGGELGTTFALTWIGTQLHLEEEQISEARGIFSFAANAIDEVGGLGNRLNPVTLLHLGGLGTCLAGIRESQQEEENSHRSNFALLNKFRNNINGLQNASLPCSAMMLGLAGMGQSSASLALPEILTAGLLIAATIGTQSSTEPEHIEKATPLPTAQAVLNLLPHEDYQNAKQKIVEMLFDFYSQSLREQRIVFKWNNYSFHIQTDENGSFSLLPHDRNWLIRKLTQERLTKTDRIRFAALLMIEERRCVSSISLKDFLEMEEGPYFAQLQLLAKNKKLDKDFEEMPEIYPALMSLRKILRSNRLQTSSPQAYENYVLYIDLFTQHPNLQNLRFELLALLRSQARRNRETVEESEAPILRLLNPDETWPEQIEREKKESPGNLEMLNSHLDEVERRVDYVGLFDNPLIRAIEALAVFGGDNLLNTGESANPVYRNVVEGLRGVLERDFPNRANYCAADALVSIGSEQALNVLIEQINRPIPRGENDYRLRWRREYYIQVLSRSKSELARTRLQEILNQDPAYTLKAIVNRTSNNSDLFLNFADCDQEQLVSDLQELFEASLFRKINIAGLMAKLGDSEKADWLLNEFTKRMASEDRLLELLDEFEKLQDPRFLDALIARYLDFSENYKVRERIFKLLLNFREEKVRVALLRDRKENPPRQDDPYSEQNRALDQYLKEMDAVQEPLEIEGRSSHHTEEWRKSEIARVLQSIPQEAAFNPPEEAVASRMGLGLAWFCSSYDRENTYIHTMLNVTLMTISFGAIASLLLVRSYNLLGLLGMSLSVLFYHYVMGSLERNPRMEAKNVPLNYFDNALYVQNYERLCDLSREAQRRPQITFSLRNNKKVSLYFTTAESKDNPCVISYWDQKAIKDRLIHLLNRRHQLELLSTADPNLTGEDEKELAQLLAIYDFFTGERGAVPRVPAELFTGVRALLEKIKESEINREAELETTSNPTEEVEKKGERED